MVKYLSRFLLILIAVTLSLSKAENDEGVIITNAKLTEINIDLKKLDKYDTELSNNIAKLLMPVGKENPEMLKQLMEYKEESLKIFKVSYNTLITNPKGKSESNKQIIQYGFVRLLPVSLQERLSANKEQQIIIRFDRSEPLKVKFFEGEGVAAAQAQIAVIQQKAFDVGPLVIDDKEYNFFQSQGLAE